MLHKPAKNFIIFYFYGILDNLWFNVYSKLVESNRSPSTTSELKSKWHAEKRPVTRSERKKNSPNLCTIFFSTICRRSITKSKCQTRKSVWFYQWWSSRKLQEIFVLENSIKSEKEKQQKHLDHMMKRGELSMALRWILMKSICLLHCKVWTISRLAIQHMLDVLRHVGTPDFYTTLEFPTVALSLPVLQFNSSLPNVPMVMETSSEWRKPLKLSTIKIFFAAAKLLSSLKFRVQLLMQLFQKEKDPTEVKQAMAQFQQAMIEDAVRIFRPKVPSFDYDWTLVQP